MSQPQQQKAGASRRKNRFSFFTGNGGTKRRGRPGKVRRWLERLPDELVDRKMNLYQVTALAIVGLLIYFFVMPLMGDWNPSSGGGGE
jgi:hypothetical protein